MGRSIFSNDFVPGASDIDLLVIVQRSLSDAHRRRLGDTVTSIAQQRHTWVDFRVVTADTASVPQRAPEMEFYVGIHPDLPGLVEIERGPTMEPDLLVEFAICREQGLSLCGSEPHELIGSVPHEWLLEVGDAYLRRWQEIDYDDHHAELMVFTACRIWYRYAKRVTARSRKPRGRVMRRAPDLTARPRRAVA